MSDTLIIRGGALGDFLLTLPVLRALRRAWPERRLEVLGSPRLTELARCFGIAEAARRLEDPGLARFFVPDARLDDDWRDYFAGFRTIVSYLYDPDDLFHANLRRCGTATLVRGPHKPRDDGPHATRQLAAPLRDLGLTLEAADCLPLPPTPALAEDEKAATAAPRIALHPGSGSPRKNWGGDNWRALAREVAARHGATFLLVSGEAEEPFIQEFSGWLITDGVPHERAHGLPLPELAARLATCRLFLGHDTGPAHLAAACGTPCVLVFGPTDPAVWAPAGERTRVLRHPSGSLASVGREEMLNAVREVIG